MHCLLPPGADCVESSRIGYDPQVYSIRDLKWGSISTVRYGLTEPSIALPAEQQGLFADLIASPARTNTS